MHVCLVHMVLVSKRKVTICLNGHSYHNTHIKLPTINLRLKLLSGSLTRLVWRISCRNITYATIYTQHTIHNGASDTWSHLPFSLSGYMITITYTYTQLPLSSVKGMVYHKIHPPDSVSSVGSWQEPLLRTAADTITLQHWGGVYHQPLWYMMYHQSYIILLSHLSSSHTSTPCSQPWVSHTFKDQKRKQKQERKSFVNKQPRFQLAVLVFG